MDSRARKLNDRISTIHTEKPEAIRREIVEILEEHFSCDLALFFRCARDTETDEHLLTGLTGTGDPELVHQLVTECEGKAFDAPWLPTNIDREEIDAFVRLKNYYEDSYHDIEINRNVLGPIGISDQMRAALYDGRKMIGWVGMMRRGKSEFSVREQQRAMTAVGRFKASLAAADALESEILDDGIYAVFDATGTTEHASETFTRWCNDEQRRYLSERIRIADRGGGREGIEVHTGAEVRLTRLDATESVRYLVSVERPELIKLRPEYWLTERQRQIAEYAVAGATNREIADTLELSLHTVKTHMKNIYRRLGVASRTELVVMLDHLR